MSAYQLAHFTLWGDFDCQEVTTALSLTPSSTIEKGDRLEVDGESVSARVATWDLYGPDGMTLGEQLDFLATTLWDRADEVEKLTKRFRSGIVLVFTSESGANTVTLEPEMMRKFADMNIALTCDRVGEEAEDAD
jgi:hypothetical protein